MLLFDGYSVNGTRKGASGEGVGDAVSLEGSSVDSKILLEGYFCRWWNILRKCLLWMPFVERSSVDGRGLFTKQVLL